jgi:RPA family protein
MKERVDRIFAGEFNRSDLVLAQRGPGGQPSLLTPTGLSIGRITIAGALTEVEGAAGDFVHARVADPTGVFTLRSGWHRPEVTASLARIEPPAFVAVTASPLLPSRAPVSRPILLTEAIAEVDRLARDTWVIATADGTLARLEELSATLAGGKSDEVLARAITHYRVTPSFLLELTDMVETALASIMAGAGGKKDVAGGKDPRELVVAYLAARPGETIPVEAILAELGRQGIDAGAATRAMKELLAEGECYMPRKGSVRLA